MLTKFTIETDHRQYEEEFEVVECKSLIDNDVIELSPSVFNPGKLQFSGYMLMPTEEVARLYDWRNRVRQKILDLAAPYIHSPCPMLPKFQINSASEVLVGCMVNSSVDTKVGFAKITLFVDYTEKK